MAIRQVRKMVISDANAANIIDSSQILRNVKYVNLFLILLVEMDILGIIHYWNV